MGQVRGVWMERARARSFHRPPRSASTSLDLIVLSPSLSLSLSLSLSTAQAMSFGLTQYDVEELIDYCGGKCVCVCVCVRERERKGLVLVREEERGVRFPPLISQPPPPFPQSTRRRSSPCTAASAPWTGGARAS